MIHTGSAVEELFENTPIEIVFATLSVGAEEVAIESMHESDLTHQKIVALLHGILYVCVKQQREILSLKASLALQNDDGK